MAPNVFHIGVKEQVSISVFDAANPVTVKLHLQDYPNRQKTFSQVQGRVQQGNFKLCRVYLYYLPPNEREPLVHPHEVCKKLLSVQHNKAMGPDNIRPRIIKEFAYELVEPVTTIFNLSLFAGVVPNIWKESNITPIPKVKQPQNEGDIRPISLTPIPYPKSWKTLWLPA